MYINHSKLQNNTCVPYTNRRRQRTLDVWVNGNNSRWDKHPRVMAKALLTSSWTLPPNTRTITVREKVHDNINVMASRLTYTYDSSVRTVCVIRIEEASAYHTNRPCIQSFCIEKKPFQSLLLRSDSSKRKKAVYISEMKTSWRMFQKAPMQHRKPGQRYAHWANVGPKLDQPSFTWAERKPLFLVTAGWTPKIHGLVYCVEFLTPLLTRVFIEQ